MPGKKISVIIPVKNGASTLAKCLESVQKQTLVADIEIIILDSMSTDDSMKIAATYPVKIIQIPGGSFNHGISRNLGVQQATGDLIFFTVQDAWLAANDMLERMVTHFDNQAVMGVVGHQAVPHEKDKNPLLWFRRYSEPKASYRKVDDWQQFRRLPEAEQQSLIAWDNVVAMYRRSALLQQPFVATEFAEDWIWSEQALKRGWTLVHDPFLVAWHYHHRDYDYAFKVAYAVNYHFYKFFHFTPVRPALLKPLLKGSYHVIINSRLGLKEKLYWTRHNWASMLGDYASHVNFLRRLKKGGIASIEKGYHKYCKKVPQGTLKK